MRVCAWRHTKSVAEVNWGGGRVGVRERRVRWRGTWNPNQAQFNFACDLFIGQHFTFVSFMGFNVLWGRDEFRTFNKHKIIVWGQIICSHSKLKKKRFAKWIPYGVIVCLIPLLSSSVHCSNNVLDKRMRKGGERAMYVCAGMTVRRERETVRLKICSLRIPLLSEWVGYCVEFAPSMSLNCFESLSLSLSPSFWTKWTV